MKKLLALLLMSALLVTTLGASALAEGTPVITMMMSGDNTPSEDNLVLQEIEKRTGIKLVVNYVAGSDYNQKLNTMIASETLPDIFHADGQTGIDLRDAGKLCNIEELLEQYGQNALAELGDDLKRMPINQGDGIYGVRNNSEGKIDNMVIRKDWLKAVGKEVPTNLEELYDVLYAFTYNDPDGNGVKDTYGLSVSLKNSQNWEHFFAAYGIAYKKNYLMEDGTVTTYMKAPDYLEVIKYLRRLYHDGIMDPDFATLSNMQTFEKLWNGEIGFYAWEAVGPTNNWYPSRYTFEVPEDPADLFAAVHFEGKTGGCRQYTSYIQPWVISATCADPAAAIRLLDYIMYTEEGNELINYGVEGVMWEWVDEANGKLRRLGIYTDDATHRAAGGYVYGNGWKVNNAEIRLLNQFTRQLQADERAIATDYPYIIQMLETRSEYGTTLDNICQEAFANLIVCDDSELESLYAEYVQQWNDEGGLEFEEEATKAYHEENPA